MCVSLLYGTEMPVFHPTTYSTTLALEPPPPVEAMLTVWLPLVVPDAPQVQSSTWVPFVVKVSPPVMSTHFGEPLSTLYLD